MKNILADAAAIIAISASIPYLIDIIKGKTKPNIVSWLTWTILLVIGTSAAFIAKETNSALLTLGDTIGTGLTLVLGIKYGFAKFTKLDIFCQLGAFIGLILWLVFNSPSVGIVSVVIIDLIGSIPTLYHSWQNPQEETWQTFLVISFASTLTLFSISRYNIPSLAYPIYLLIINLAVALVVIYRRLKLNIDLKRHSIHESLHE